MPSVLINLHYYYKLLLSNYYSDLSLPQEGGGQGKWDLSLSLSRPSLNKIFELLPLKTDGIRNLYILEYCMVRTQHCLLNIREQHIRLTEEVGSSVGV